MEVKKRMSKTQEGLNPKIFEGTPAKKPSTKGTEKSRDYFNYFPGTKRIIAYVSEKEYREVVEAHEREN
jgi:hypothetical protein